MVEPQTSQCWVVESACCLGDVLDRMGQSFHAARTGRVFVDGRRRLDPATRLVRGAFVEVFPAVEGRAGDVEVLASHNGLVAVLKPAGISTIPDQRGHADSLIDRVASMLGELDSTHLHATSRLDRPVSGVVVFALDRKARDAVREARECHRYVRHYVALASRCPEPEAGWVDAPLGRGVKPTQRKVGGMKAVEAKTHYGTTDRAGGAAMVSVEPETGRTHQIRVHLAHVGAPLVGDDKYGGSRRWVLATGEVLRVDRIALHAAWVEIGLMKGAEPWRVEAPIPGALRDLWHRLGGAEEAWSRALLPLGVLGRA